MNTILKNFWSVVRKYKMAAALNVLGLSTAFAAFMIIMMQVTYEWTYERCHPHSDRIVTVTTGREGATYVHPRAFVDAMITASPHITAGTIFTPLNRWMGDNYVTVGDSVNPLGFRVPFVTCHADITRIFGFNFIEGDPACLNDPEKVIIPESMARKMFGSSSAIGRRIRPEEYVWTKGNEPMTIGGVYRDFPGNTQIDNVIYARIDNTMQGAWSASNFLCYLLVDGQIPLEELEAEINRTFPFPDAYRALGEDCYVHLSPIRNNYFSEVNFKSGNASLVSVLFAIALLVIIIAAINFTNFSIALSPMRVKSINTHKIFGASTSVLRASMTCEALFLSLLAWIAAVGITSWLDSVDSLSFIEADSRITNNVSILIMSGCVAIITGLIAGLYPALYTTSFQPALALKGRFALSSSGRTIRMGLIGFQFFISIALIISALFVQMQSKYMKGFDSGFDKEQIAIVYIGNQIYRNSREAYSSLLREHPGISDVAFSKQKLGGGDRYTFYQLPYLNENYSAYTLDVSDNFLRVMGINIIEGRDFSPADTQDSDRLGMIMNRPLHESTGAPVGTAFPLMGHTFRLTGVTGDLKFTSARQGEDHIAFVVGSGAALTFSYVRINAGANIHDVVSHIRKSMNEIDPTFPVDVEFYDTVIDDLYRNEENLNSSITLLSILAIIISIVGVFGLVLFEAEYRRREISLRKVYGADTGSILLMFNGVYFRIVIVCFALASPVAYLAVSRWLENFAYRTPLHWWVFPLALVSVAIITGITVTFQNLRAANANPVESMKGE
jgi:putative ABC transport system permease protein